MRGMIPLVVVLVGALLVGGCSMSGGVKEEQVTIDKVPAAVKATIEAQAAGAKVTEIEKKTVHGKTFYEAEWMKDGKEVEVKIDEAGKVMPKHSDKCMCPKCKCNPCKCAKCTVPAATK